MAFFSILLAFVFASVSTFATPSVELAQRAGTPSATGIHDGFFYSWWTDNASQATYANGDKGNFEMIWTSGGSLSGGKGWSVGAGSRVISYAGTYVSQGDAFLSVHGWTKNPLIEYYIVENFGTYNPYSGAIKKGNLTTDGAVYDIGRDVRINQPSIDGLKTFERFVSVRRTKRTGGTVDVGAHFRAWAEAGMNLGKDHAYQIISCESYGSSGGSCNITVSSD